MVSFDSPLFDEKVSFNLRKVDRNKIRRIVRRNFEKYQDSESIFIRCAVLKQIREDEVTR